MADAVRISGVSVRRGGSLLLSDVSLAVQEGERWVVMGPNGAGKTTLMQIASGRMFPTVGEVVLLGEAMGAVDLAELKPRIGWASSAMVAAIPPGESVLDVVVTGAWAVSGRWTEHYDGADLARGQWLLGQWGMGALVHRTFGTLSEGERKRAVIARALMSDPELLLLDEPGAGLDLGGREDLVERLGRLARDPDAPTQVIVTHHVEEIPDGFTHALLMREGSAIASGALGDVIADEPLSEAFGMPITVLHDDGRWFARRAPVG